MSPPSPLPFVSLINIKPAPTWPTISSKTQNNWWLFDWPWPSRILGELRGKKQKHLIYSSIRMEINGLCLSDTPPLSTHTFSTTGILPTICISWRSAKAETGRGTESHCCNKHCHLHKLKLYDNTFKDKRLLFLRKSPVSVILL